MLIFIWVCNFTMNKFFSLPIFLILYFYTSSATIMTTSVKSSCNIAIVDMEYILQNSFAVIDLKSKLDSITKDIHHHIALEELALKKAESDIKLSKIETNNKQQSNNLHKKITEIKTTSQQKKIKLEKAYSDGIIAINKEIVSIIKDICVNEGYNVVFPESQIIYCNDNLNISDSVLKKLNHKITHINIDLK